MHGICFRERRTVEDYLLVCDLDPVASDADHPLDKRLPSIKWVRKDYDFTTVRRGLWDSLGEHVVANQKGVLHRAVRHSIRAKKEYRDRERQRNRDPRSSRTPAHPDSRHRSP